MSTPKTVRRSNKSKNPSTPEDKMSVEDVNDLVKKAEKQGCIPVALATEKGIKIHLLDRAFNLCVQGNLNCLFGEEELFAVMTAIQNERDTLYDSADAETQDAIDYLNIHQADLSLNTLLDLDAAESRNLPWLTSIVNRMEEAGKAKPAPAFSSKDRDIEMLQAGYDRWAEAQRKAGVPVPPERSDAHEVLLSQAAANDHNWRRTIEVLEAVGDRVRDLNEDAEMANAKIGYVDEKLSSAGVGSRFDGAIVSGWMRLVYDRAPRGSFCLCVEDNSKVTNEDIRQSRIPLVHADRQVRIKAAKALPAFIETIFAKLREMDEPKKVDTPTVYPANERTIECSECGELFKDTIEYAKLSRPLCRDCVASYTP